MNTRTNCIETPTVLAGRGVRQAMAQLVEELRYKPEG